MCGVSPRSSSLMQGPVMTIAPIGLLKCVLCRPWVMHLPPLVERPSWCLCARARACQLNRVALPHCPSPTPADTPSLAPWAPGRRVWRAGGEVRPTLLSLTNLEGGVSLRLPPDPTGVFAPLPSANTTPAAICRRRAGNSMCRSFDRGGGGHTPAETTPAGAPAAAADRKQRPDATCGGKNG